MKTVACAVGWFAAGIFVGAVASLWAMPVIGPSQESPWYVVVPAIPYPYARIYRDGDKAVEAAKDLTPKSAVITVTHITD